MNSNLTQFMRIGIHSEADFFRKAKPLYDALIINANLVQATPAASAALVYGLGKKFLIDPFTHAFSLSPKYLMSKSKGKAKTLRVKRSFSGMASSYFADSSFLGERALAPSDVIVEEFTTRVLDFQNSVLSNAVKDLAGVFPNPEVFKPSWVIAPYFPLRLRSTNWLDVNLKCLAAAVERDKDSSAIIPIEFNVLRDSWKEIADQYTALKPNSLFLWIESFDEDRADEDDLKLYCDFVARIAAAGVKPVNLFGGFFSLIAHCIGLSGFAHGLVYGENKSFTPVVGGGQPPPRYYLKPAHISVNVREAELVLSDVGPPDYLQNVCDCTICAGLFNGQDDLTNFAQFSETNDQGKFMPRAYALCRYHFLFARHDEIVKMASLKPEERVQALLSNVNFLQRIEAYDYAEHLLTWINVLNSICK